MKCRHDGELRECLERWTGRTPRRRMWRDLGIGLGAIIFVAAVLLLFGGCGDAPSARDNPPPLPASGANVGWSPQLGAWLSDIGEVYDARTKTWGDGGGGDRGL